MASALPPIPRDLVRDTTGYRTVPFDSTSKEQHEPLVTLADEGIATDAYYARSRGTNPPYNGPLPGAEAEIRVRAGIAQRLTAVNRRLERHGVEVLVLDGYRSLACQRALWVHFVKTIGRANPRWPRQRVERHALQYASDPRAFSAGDPRTWLPHITGGAVDLTLRRRGHNGEWLYMGGVFDDPSPVSHTRYYETDARAIGLSGREARHNRRLLYWAMTREAFVNLSTEWWHFDWGTQLWALSATRRRGAAAAHAVYGPISSGSKR